MTLKSPISILQNYTKCDCFYAKLQKELINSINQFHQTFHLGTKVVWFQKFGVAYSYSTGFFFLHICHRVFDTSYEILNIQEKLLDHPSSDRDLEWVEGFVTVGAVLAVSGYDVLVKDGIILGSFTSYCLQIKEYLNSHFV